MQLNDIKQILIGKPIDPMNPKARHTLTLAAFLAWVGLGADGLSSSAYGPEETFKALGTHTGLGLYMVIATALTVFIIALAYNQVIELFPTGGGGYRVATKLVGPYWGLVSGAALILDYVLTVAISVASGVDALASFLPPGFITFKLWAAILITVILITLNLRGMKEAITVLLPIFLGFVVTHAILIVYGIGAHATELPALVPATWAETTKLAGQTSWLAVVGLLMLAYSQGGGTYTGLEAVSNNVNVLKEPRVKTGKMTMFYMALSLAFTAGGIILLYLLWGAKHVEGQTLNAVTFKAILDSMGMSSGVSHTALVVTLVFEAGLLFVAANTGFLGGPAVLSNMAADSWAPHQFRSLSTRLVTQNGILGMGIAALAILIWTRGSVALLVVLYSVSVFLTFAISLFGLMVYWWRHRKELEHWKRRLALSFSGFAVCFSILIVLVWDKFAEGAWVALVIIALLSGAGYMIREHYRETKRRIGEIDRIFANVGNGSVTEVPAIDANAPTAVFVIGTSRGGGLHALLWVQRMFPDHFKNFVFIGARTVDVEAFGGDQVLADLQKNAARDLQFFVDFSHSNGLAAKSWVAFGTDAVEEICTLSDQVMAEFPSAIFFTSKLIFENEHWYTKLLHNQASLQLQSRLHLKGQQMIILGMKV